MHPKAGLTAAFAPRDPNDVTPADSERLRVVESCALRLPVRIPVVIDGIEDGVAAAYGAWPDRLYLVGRDGRIAFQGGTGPFGFLPEELEAAIEEELEGQSREPRVTLS